MKSVNEKPCPKTWTGEVVMKDGRLPDLRAWRRCFRKIVGEGFTLRGVEATVSGRVFLLWGQPVLYIPEIKVALPLRPLRHTIQYDPARKQPRPPTARESEAYRALVTRLAQPGAGPRRFRVTGLLHQSGAGSRLGLAVREFVLK